MIPGDEASCTWREPSSAISIRLWLESHGFDFKPEMMVSELITSFNICVARSAFCFICSLCAFEPLIFSDQSI